MRPMQTGLRLCLWMVLLTGVVYPALVTLIASGLFPNKAHGVRVLKNENVRGFERIGQQFSSARYFWPRPSTHNYNALMSGGSQLAPTSKRLQELVEERRQRLLSAHALPADTPLPADLLFASASGLDPHISLEAAWLQIDRVAAARGFDETQRQVLALLVENATEQTRWGLLGPRCVHVLKLNMALDIFDNHG
jgi:K+-transporting ATPase ATPase C chain